MAIINMEIEESGGVSVVTGKKLHRGSFAG